MSEEGAERGEGGSYAYEGSDEGSSITNSNNMA